LGYLQERSQRLYAKVIITNGRLELVDDGVEFVIKTDKAVLDGYASSLSLCLW
jgi:oligoribonuclease